MDRKIITCHETLAVTNHRVLASDLNEHDTVYGGRILELLDGNASIAAARLARCQTVTAAVDRFDFIAPFALHDSLCLVSYVSGAGHRSLEVFTKILGEHLATGERFLGGTAFLTFVVPDKTVSLPNVQPQSAEEKAVCAAYPDRLARSKAARQSRASWQEFLDLKGNY